MAGRARGKGEHDRKQLRFPALRRVYAPSRSYWDDVRTYLETWAYRTMNDLQGLGYLPPSHEQLVALFEARIRERGSTWHRLDGRRAGLELETVEALADEAASAALRDWSESWIAARREAGRKGGSRAKPPRRAWDDDDLAVLALYGHLSPGEVIRRYNAGRAKPLSRATLYRMISALRERQQAAPSRVERSPHAPLTKRQELAFERELQAEQDEAYRRTAETEERAASEREHAEHLARLALLAQRPPEPARDLDVLLPA